MHSGKLEKNHNFTTTLMEKYYVELSTNFKLILKYVFYTQILDFSHK